VTREVRATDNREPSPEPEPELELEPLPVTWEIALVLLCEAVVVFGLVKELGCLSGGTGHAAYVCASDSAKPWYERSLVLAAVVASVGALIGHRRRSWRIVWGAVAVSGVISVVTLLWGLRGVTVG
jgi:hypothetical protein